MDEYASQLGIFSPDGRLFPVEYAQQASKQGGTIIVETDGSRVTVCYETKNINSLVLPTPKIQPLDTERGIYVVFSGFKADSQPVVEEARRIVCNHKYATSEDISLVRLARSIADFKQKFTVSHTMRPFGLRTVLFGLDGTRARIFVIETDGNYSEYTKCALGHRHEQCSEQLARPGYSGLRVLAEATQSDYEKMKAFVLDGRGLIELSMEQMKVN